MRVHYVIIITICIILCDQLVHIYRLYDKVKSEYIHRQNDIISGSIYEFSMKSTNMDTYNLISFNATKNVLTYIINKETKIYQLSEKDDIQKISESSSYDIRKPEDWTLKNFYSYLQSKQDSIYTGNLAMQFIIQDSTGRIIDSYPEHLETLPSSPEYKEPLGYISGDTLYATYNYPFCEFIQVAMWSITITIIITALLIFFIIDLYQSIRKEKKKGEYRELYIHNIVHDLKRPLEDQIKVCYLLTSKPFEEVSPLVNVSREQLNEMLQSIYRMLLQSTDEHGLRLNVEEINLQEMLKTLVKQDRWNVPNDKQLEINMNFQSEKPMITGDSNFLFAVFTNFVDNSLKYSGKQVTIQITCTDLDDKHVEIRFQDNGIGISAANLKHVFERYNRGDHQRNAKIKGYGQGLHYARMIITAHGGVIRAESEINKGTTIIVCLPREARVKNKYKE